MDCWHHEREPEVDRNLVSRGLPGRDDGVATASPQAEWDVDQDLRLNIDFHLDSNEQLRCVEEHDGVLWIGSDKGLYLYDRGSRRVAKVFPRGMRPVLVRNQSPCLVFIDEKTPSGSVPMMACTNSLKTGRDQKPEKKPMIEGAVYCLTEVEQTLWIGTTRALYRWDDWARAGTVPRDNQLAGIVYHLAYDEKGKTPLGRDHERDFLLRADCFGRVGF